MTETEILEMRAEFDKIKNKRTDKHALDLAIQLANAYTEFYESGNPLISDSEWDKFYHLIQRLELLYGARADSPTQRIVPVVLDELTKVTHNHPMLSLPKTKDTKEVLNFFGKQEWIAMPKMDGLTCSLWYKDGKLFRAETRGNGIEGEDITSNVYSICDVPRKIPRKDEFIVDGEIYCDTKIFAEKWSDVGFSTPRNFAAGSIRLLDNQEVAKRQLHFAVWAIIKGSRVENTFSNQLMEASNLGFNVVKSVTSQTYGNNLGVAINHLKDNAVRNNRPIDGIVFKLNQLSELEAAQIKATAHHLGGAIAYKFQDDEYETKLVDIEWSLARTGVITPIAVYEPIDIDGTICTRASLHNISVFRSVLGKKPFRGQIIFVSKANQIIPQVIRSIKEEDDDK